MTGLDVFVASRKLIPMSDRLLHSTLDCEVRSIDREHRAAVFVASTENPVRTWGDPEVLRMSGVRLERYLKNPVLLDTHGRQGLDSIIGSCTVEVRDRKLVATARYADTARGENAWRLVEGGHCRAMSIGYSVNPQQVRRLRPGEVDGEGEARVEGPASIVNEWNLLEISNVPVPADEDAVRRSYFETLESEDAPVASNSGINFTRALGEAGDLDPTPPVTQTVATPAASVRNVAEEFAEERAARIFEAKRRQALAITPRGLEHIAETALTEDQPLEVIRARLLEAQAARFKPLGTSEPVAASNPIEDLRTKPLPDWVTDDVLVRSLESLGS